jgi:hypothetical protein
MAANPPEIRISPVAAGRFLRCRLALKLPKEVFSIGIHPLGPGDYMPSQKLFIDVSVYMFTSDNLPSAA